MAKKEKKADKIQLSDWDKKVLAKQQLLAPENMELRIKAKYKL
tara:strand:+ start:96 stop:224 length:129 start_codon:yes stop_codon:yes gene_type:complete